ncbi:MAG: hypothetical protein ACJA16_003716 [Akkermansiaceae bacterium]|jgi:hypothetical protein
MQIQVIANFVMFSVITLLRDGHMLHQVKLQLLGICFLRGALEDAVDGIGDGEKGGC